MILTLYTLRSDESGTFSELLMGNERLCVTCEDPWNENEKGKSCIPGGMYQFVPHTGPEYQDVWRAVGVPGRDGILIHNGNTIKDTRGCILVGSQFGKIDGMPAVLNSRKTLDMLREALPERFIMTIRRPWQ